MSVTNADLMTSDGRIRGAYVYLLLCQDDVGRDPIHGKFGVSTSPLRCVVELRPACPATPQRLAFVHVHSRSRAEEIEEALLAGCQPWRLRGEWIRLAQGSKHAFNETWSRVFRLYTTPTWPLRWTQMPIAPILAQCR